MLRKIFSVTLIAVTILLTACGQKLPDSGADKTVEAYAQLYTCGEIDDELKHATNLSDADIVAAHEKVIAPLLCALKQYPLSEETSQGITKKFLDRMKKLMDITATLEKGDDSARPVVELVTTTINPETVELFAEEDDGLNALKAELAELKALGVTDDELKQNLEIQKLALETIGNFVGEFNMNERATILVPCKIVTGTDGKLYWQPENVDAISQHISGQK